MVVESAVDVVDNDLSGNQFGLNVAGTGAQVRDNRFRDNLVGLLISSSSSVRTTSLTLEGNTVEGNVRGISIKGGTSTSLIGNVICGNETNIDVVDGADVTFEDNEICEDAPSPAVASPTVP
jgi:parallel beta-helix repeat protein